MSVADRPCCWDGLMLRLSGLLLELEGSALGRLFDLSGFVGGFRLKLSPLPTISCRLACPLSMAVLH